MSAWPVMRLDECCEIVSGATPSTSVPAYWDGDINWATPKDLADLDGPVIAETPRKITKAGLDSCAASILPPGSVLFSSRAPIGHVAINAAPMATNQGFKSFVPRRDRMHAGYLYHWLRCHRSYMESLGNGATFKEVSKAVVARVEVPVPPVAEQRRIAAILDEADALRAKRRAALGRLTELVSAMFDEAYESSGAELTRASLQSLAAREQHSFVNGPFGSDLLTSELQDEGVPVVYIRDIRDGEYTRRSAVHVTPDKARKLAFCNVRPGDILVAKVGDPPGIAAVYPDDQPPAIVTQDVIRLRVDGERVRPAFLSAYLNSVRGKAAVAAITIEATRARFPLGAFKGLEVELPSPKVQLRFEAQAREAARQLTRQRAHLTTLDSLFASLQHRAFRGEL